MSNSIQVAVVDDDVKLSRRLALWLSSKQDLSVGATLQSVEELILSAKQKITLDVIILDIKFANESSIPKIKKIKKVFPGTAILILSSFWDDEYVFAALRAGANGYCLKGSGLEQLETAVLHLASGEAYLDPKIAKKVATYFSSENKQVEKKQLTNREIEVLLALLDGLSYKLIASRLGITIHTVRHYIRGLYSKLEVNSKHEVIAMAYRGEIEGLDLA